MNYVTKISFKKCLLLHQLFMVIGMLSTNKLDIRIVMSVIIPFELQETDHRKHFENSREKYLREAPRASRPSE
jgi:hypothetical protein